MHYINEQTDSFARLFSIDTLDIVQAAAAGVSAAFTAKVKFIHQYGISAADSLANADRLTGTIPGAGAALHAGVPVGDGANFFVKGKDLLRAYFYTHAAAITFILVHFQGYYIL